MIVQLPPPSVVQPPDPGDNFPPAPYFELTDGTFPSHSGGKTRFHRSQRFAVHMIKWPRQQIAYHTQWIPEASGLVKPISNFRLRNERCLGEV